MMPSQRRILASFETGLTERSKGAITVGPVTIEMAPNSSAISHEISSTQCAVRVPIVQVTMEPIGTRLRTITPWPLIS